MAVNMKGTKKYLSRVAVQQQQIGDLNNEIKVMACNLQGFDEEFRE